MHVAYIGNFEPEHSTENEVRRALENNGHEVVRRQEGLPDALDALIDNVGSFDLVLWTRTGGLAAKSGDARYWRLLATAHKAGVPVVGYHLDRWWGLKRQSEIELDPFFRVDLLCTADGGHDDQWEKVGVNHAWFPPGISERHCHLGTPRPEYASDIAFVGSWQPGYHDEWGHRSRLVRWLRKNYDRRVRLYPDPGQHAVRGDDLNDLYASVKVVVGDSCLVPKPDGSPMTHYCSDRVPETLGRGGMLIHPSVEGIDELFPMMFQWSLDNWGQLGDRIEYMLAKAEDFAWPGDDAVAHVRQYHTYEVRVRQLVTLLQERGMIS